MPYHTVIQAFGEFLDREPHFVHALFLASSSEDQDGLKALLLLFYPKIKALQLFEWFLAQEIQSFNDYRVMFREDTPTTKLMTLILKLSGKEYLHKCLAKTIKRFVNRPLNLEVRPERASAEEVNQHRKHAIEIAQIFLSKIFSSIAEIPSMIKMLCSCIEEALEKKFGTEKEDHAKESNNNPVNTNTFPRSLSNSHKSFIPFSKKKERNPSDLPVDTSASASTPYEFQSLVVASGLFLHFLCPAIVSPKQSQIVKEEVSNVHAARGLILIAKLLQGVANDSQFEKETYMTHFSTFLEKNQPHYQQFSRTILEEGDVLRKLHLEGGSYQSSTKAVHQSKQIYHLKQVFELLKMKWDQLALLLSSAPTSLLGQLTLIRTDLEEVFSSHSASTSPRYTQSQQIPGTISPLTCAEDMALFSSSHLMTSPSTSPKRSEKKKKSSTDDIQRNRRTIEINGAFPRRKSFPLPPKSSQISGNTNTQQSAKKMASWIKSRINSGFDHPLTNKSRPCSMSAILNGTPGTSPPKGDCLHSLKLGQRHHPAPEDQRKRVSYSKLDVQNSSIVVGFPFHSLPKEKDFEYYTYDYYYYCNEDIEDSKDEPDLFKDCFSPTPIHRLIP